MHKPNTELELEDNTKNYDDCGVDLPVEYPTTVNEFLHGFYNTLPKTLKDMADVSSTINKVATQVEQDAEAIAARDRVAVCEVQALENVTGFLKDGFAYIAKHAAEMAETAKTNANLYEAAAAVAALAYGVMAHQEEQEQQTKEALEVLEHDFETVAQAAELVREATVEQKHHTYKLAL